MKRLVWLFVLVVCALTLRAQTAVYPVKYTVATLPAAATMKDRTVVVTDGVAPGSCKVGGGTTRTWCFSTGTEWVPLRSGNAGQFTNLDFANKTVTVPAPTSAPGLTAQGPENIIAGSFTASTTYRVVYTYLVFDGTPNGQETGPSPYVSFTAAGLQGISVLPKAVTNNNSKYVQGCFFYISNDGGSTYHKADGVFLTRALLSFGDDQSWLGGGAPIMWNASGAAPPAGGTTATTFGGRTVSPPASAPDLFNTFMIPANTYHAAYCWTAGDGSDGALSPVSSGVGMVDRKWFQLTIPQEPPSGAVKVKIYLGTSSTPASLHLQATVPLNHVRPVLHTYNASGAAPSAGTAQSVLSGLQQAIDAAKDSGGAKVMVSGLVETQVPLILRLKNAGGSQTARLSVVGTHHDGLGNASSKINYTGTQTDVVGIAFFDTDVYWDSVDLNDPNNRVRYALAGGDFFGGGGFLSRWHNSMFSAGANSSVSLYVPVESASAGAHGVSNQYFSNIVFIARSWAVDLHQAQMGSMKFHNCGASIYNFDNSANTGYWRLAGGFNVDVDGADSGGSPAMYTVFLTGDSRHPQSAAPSAITFKNHHTEAQSNAGGPFSFIHASQSSGGYPRVGLISNSFSQVNDLDFMAWYSATGGSLTVVDNDRGNGNAWFNQVTTTQGQYEKMNIAIVGRDNFFGIDAYSDNFGTPFPWKFAAKGLSMTMDYAHPSFSSFIGAYALINELGKMSTIRTNAAGDLDLRPNSGRLLVNGDTAVDPPQVFNAQTGTSYTIVAGDNGKFLTLNNGSSIAVSIPQATGSFGCPSGACFTIDIGAIGAGTATVTPTTSTIDATRIGGTSAQSSLAIASGKSVRLVSNGTNYVAYNYQGRY